MDLLEAYEHYYSDKRILGYSEHTLKGYKIQIGLLYRYIGDKSITDITYLDLKKYLASFTDKLKPSTIGHKVRFIRSIFKYFHEEGMLLTNPSAKLREPKQGKRIPKYIHEEDMEIIKEACSNLLEKSLISLLYSTGCRIGEVHKMNLTDVNWDNRSIIVIGKGDKEREVYFDTKTYIFLKEYITNRIDNEEALFVLERKPFTRSSIAQLRYVVKRVARNSNININVYPHRFRHSFCTHLLDRGAGMDVISNLAGHQKISTTQIYAQLSGQKRKELYRKYF